MKIAVIGAGGVGGIFGAALQRGGHELLFVARGRHLAAMQEKGLRIYGARGESLVAPVAATADISAVGAADVVLLTVKLWDVGPSVDALTGVIGPDTMLLTLQNGVDAPAMAAERLGRHRVAAGSGFVNAGITEPGVIHQRSAVQKIVAGLLDGTVPPALARLRDACEGSGIEFEIPPHPLEALWEKFIQLVPISATTALLRGPIGAVREDADAWNLFLQIQEETIAVGRATGVRIPEEVVQRRLSYILKMPFEATASMAVDMANGQRLELPWLSGRVSELGRRHGVSTPANDFVNTALKPYVMGANAISPWTALSPRASP